MKYFLSVLLLIASVLFLLTLRPAPTRISYGMSFTKLHADELKLDWKETYLALLNDLGVRHFRFSAHWPNTEPQEGKYNFTELDFQMAQAKSHNAEVILAIGRRLPGWPECHDPEWVKIDEVVTRTLSLIPRLNSSTSVSETRTVLTQILQTELDTVTVFVPFHINFGIHIASGRQN